MSGPLLGEGRVCIYDDVRVYGFFEQLRFGRHRVTRFFFFNGYLGSFLIRATASGVGTSVPVVFRRDDNLRCGLRVLRLT